MTNSNEVAKQRPESAVPLPAALFADIDRSGLLPLYHQVATRIEDAILTGRIPPGSRLENEIALAARLAVSRPTIRRAIQALVDKGLLVRRRGIGTRVVPGHVTRDVELTSLFDDLTANDQRPTTRVLLCEPAPASTETAGRLGVAAGETVLHIRRLRSANGTPLSILENHLPGEFADLDPMDLERQGLYRLLRGRNVTLKVARQQIGARSADAAEARLLGLKAAGGALLTMDRVAYDHSGRAIEAGHHCYRPDLYSFEVTLVEK